MKLLAECFDRIFVPESRQLRLIGHVLRDRNEGTGEILRRERVGDDYGSGIEVQRLPGRAVDLTEWHVPTLPV